MNVKESEILQANRWVEMFQRTTKAEIRSITNKICPFYNPSIDDTYNVFIQTIQSLADETHREELLELNQDLERLSKILENLKALPKNPIKKINGIIHCEIKAIDAFIDAFKMSIVWVNEPDNNKLKVGATFGFAQAYKWWKQSNKEQSSVMMGPW